MLPIVKYPSFIETDLPRLTPIFTKPSFRRISNGIGRIAQQNGVRNECSIF